MMTSTYKQQAKEIDLESRQELVNNPEISIKIDKMLDYLILEMLLKTQSLSISQMVIALGSPYGIISKLDDILGDYEAKGLIEVEDDPDDKEKVYTISKITKASEYFNELAKNMGK